ncbi:hypothetical protein SDJN02_05680, partial [Cucurbita argyrosperma subsp. argyrosperma]
MLSYSLQEKLLPCSLARKVVVVVLVGSMALLSEFLNITIFLVTRSFSFFMRTCSFIFKTFVVVQTWLELLKTLVSFHLNIFRTTSMWIIAFVSLPGRIVVALQRERQLQLNLQFLEIEFENVLWERKEFQKHFQAAMKEQKVVELMLDELEMIHEKATDKISHLESELHKLRNENLRLQEIKGKTYWSLKGLDNKGEAQNAGRLDSDITFGISSCSSIYSGSSIVQYLFQSDIWKDDNIPKARLIELLESGLKSGLRSLSSEVSKDEDDKDVAETLDEQREIAMSRSLFSTLLSLLVGMIIWKAEESHLCLVSISLKSVVEFFTTIKNKPALDAVALLSFNWFILGILAYPMLPNIARSLVLLTSRLRSFVLLLAYMGR